MYRKLKMYTSTRTKQDTLQLIYCYELFKLEHS